MDPDVAAVVQESFGKRMTLHTGTGLVRVERTVTGKRVVFTKDGTEHAAEAAEVLLALGRRAAVDGMALEAAGVDLARQGHVKVSKTMQTSSPHIFAAGDVCGEAEVVHVAIQQGEMAARNAARILRGEGGMEEMDYRLKLFGVFTEPQAAAVGMNEAEAVASGRPWKAASYPFNDHGKSMVMGAVEGFVKMIADLETGEILGASVVGPEAVELIHEVCVAMHFRCTVAEFARIPFYHPTLSEIWTYPAEDLM
jgi:pyruvate/2-oxoglutarate dehydrogenase complex dihydrolipoamide dehydrogenase (E3) component